ncbi:MAG: STAS domain-containing protein [Candidatus Eisenbacteria bacterium]|uniref:STAS domain-containing protein n=1 Tax=Eiseniibacteriota bacterium TaxID=2212470 RepID=A0A948RZ29_UNCEI|nr:STAS domain-containing protein [Candidatus Eisenbacteria bacterium]MBU1949643.1 STAS domain-containing protein [Candidatus Eisenbacteria bacterium]MBU2693036.1 STAS domain-containing protein [Candidatus Eisenbacteria bacterium]
MDLNKIKRAGDAVILPFPSGRPNEAGRRGFSDVLMALAREGKCKRIVIDLVETTWFSSIDLGVLAFALRECNQRNIALMLARVNKQALRVFEVTRMNAVFSMYDTVEEALGTG